MFILILIYQVLITIFFLYFYNKVVFKNGLLNLTIFHYIYYFAFYFFGAGILYSNHDFENNAYFFSATLYPIISLLGIYTANLISQADEKHILVFRKGAIKSIVLFAAIVIALYASTLNEIPILYVLQGNSTGAAIARSLITKEYEGPKFLFYLYRIVVDYVLVFIVIYLYLKKERLSVKLFLLLLLVVIVATLDTQKYPALNILLLLFMAAYTHKKAAENSRIDLRLFINKKVIAALIFAYLGIGILWAAVAGRLENRSTGEQLSAVIANANSMVEDRLTFGQNRMLYQTYEIVPAQYNYFYGKTFSNPLRILPYEPIPFSYLTFDAEHPEMIGGGIRGSGPAAFFGEIYANFGIVVSFLSMYVFGIFMQLINNFLTYKNKYLVPYRFLWVNYLANYSLGFITTYADEKFYFLIGLYFLLYKKIKVTND